MGQTTQIQCITTTGPAGDSATYPLFSSVSAFGGGLLPVMGGGVSRLSFAVENSQAGTLKAYMSINKGVTWTQFGLDIAVAAAAATDISGPYDFLVDPYPDVKLDWVNGGVAQATWIPIITMICGDRASGT